MTVTKRRTHHKSRLGCKNCKTRKIKCDEKKPSCSNCIRRKVDCDFTAVGTPHPNLSPTGLSMTDLELLHNYTSTTYLTLSESPTIRQFYRNTVVQVGFDCDYIMRGVLALSGLHLAHHRQHMRDHYLAAAITHHQAASQATIPLVPNATPKNAQVLFLFSVLTTYYALGWPRKSDDTLLLQENAGFPDWVYLLRGTKGFIELAGVPTSGPMAPLFSHSIARFQLREGPEASNSSANAALAELEEVIVRRPLEDEALRGVYLLAIAELKKSFGQAEACAAQYEMADAFIWVFLMAEDLLPLLRAPTQEAVAVFAYFCVLLKKLDGHWWMQGWGERLIAHAYDLLDDEGRLLIRWAVQEIGWVPPLATERWGGETSTYGDSQETAETSTV
ncbi:hypothetical protein C7999DRAFT_17397 [Corynascus novoguineensis]|uniref:Zn(2)-C6 fungal-type domain-containing protein n=1 Tax=Corynascus novoguineensis TaxID=1126955 RepID=A0AAN7CLI0_9PEZI|nr:hypothetical protein C7999DRAFT_17397 [Corynascus novoguineensis]